LWDTGAYPSLSSSSKHFTVEASCSHYINYYPPEVTIDSTSLPTLLRKQMQSCVILLVSLRSSQSTYICYRNAFANTGFSRPKLKLTDILVHIFYWFVQNSWFVLIDHQHRFKTALKHQSADAQIKENECMSCNHKELRKASTAHRAAVQAGPCICIQYAQHELPDCLASGC
jgi:hypothetical protein